MGLKTILNFLKSRFFWVNIVLAVVFAFLICLVVLWWLNSYTRHGESIEVPDLTGLYVEEAELILKDLQLNYELIDSVYLKSLRPGEIAEQSPAKGSFVKKNRKIYLTINAKMHRKVLFKDLRGESFRKAQSNYRNSGFKVDSIEYKPSEYPDELLDIKYNGKILRAGDMVTEGADLILVVGKTKMGIKAVVPVFRGLLYQDALSSIDANALMLGAVSFDDEPKDDEDKASYYVYRQSPNAGETVEAGKRVSLWFSKDKNKRYVEKSENDEEFF